MNKETLNIIILTAIILVSFAFAFLGTYYFYYEERKKVINEGIEDNLMKDVIAKKKEKFLKKRKDQKCKFKEHYYKKKKNKKIRDRIYISFTSVLLLFLLGIVGYQYLKVSNNDLVYINNKSLIVIKSESMETVNSYNTYIEENKDKESEYEYINTRINKFSLISIDKYNGEELNLFDIVAFKMKDNDGNYEIIVHRLINKTTNEKGITYYTFRGDANNASFANETNLTIDSVIGTYNGYQNTGLGYTVAFLQSEIGLIVIAIVALSLIAYQIFNDKIDTIYRDRLEKLIEDDDKPFDIFDKIKEKIEEKKLELKPDLIENNEVKEIENNNIKEIEQKDNDSNDSFTVISIGETSEK